MLATVVLISCDSGDGNSGTDSGTSDGGTTDSGTSDGGSNNGGTSGGGSNNGGTSGGGSNNGGTSGGETQAVAAESVSLDKTALTLGKGKSETLVATITPENTTNKSLTWKTSNAGVASVNNGTVTSVGTGKAIITVTTSNGKSTTCSVEVVEYSLGLEYLLSADESYYTLTGRGECTDTKIVIPDKYEGKPVKKIGEQAFYGDKKLVSVVMNSYITEIGVSSFAGCIYLGSVTIPASVEKISNYAFDSCSTLEAVYFSKNSSVSSIGSNVFANCVNLTSITIPNSVTSIGSYVFRDCAGLTSVSIGSAVTSIGYGAFDGCTNIQSATMPTIAISYIPKTNLKTVVINGESIGENAFKNMTGLTSVSIGNGVTSIGSGAFSGCTGLTRVYINDIASWCKISFDGYYSNPLCYAKKLYVNNKLVTDLVISDGVTSIGSYAFYGCTGLTSITIPNSVISIGDSAFENCSGIQSVSFESNSKLTKIGSGSFRNCSSLKSIAIPRSVTSIGSFSGCNSLESITLPFTGASVNASGYEAHFGYIFGGSWTNDPNTTSWDYYDSNTGCYYTYNIPNTLKTVIIDGATSIKAPAFQNCKGITSITISDSVTSIESGAFSGCSSLKSITLPFVGGSATATSASASTLFGYIFGTSSYTGGVITQQYYSSTKFSNYYIPASLKSVTITGGNILYGAFYNCTELTSVSIGNGVTSIGSEAFYRCTGLTGVYINDIASWCKISFYNYLSNPLYYAEKLYVNNKLVTDLVIPDGVTSIGGYAFRGCTGLTSIEIPNSVTSIGSQAFDGCTGLTSVSIGNGVTSIGSYAFYKCTGLTSIEIPNSVTRIGSYAFDGCTGLTSIIIPNSVTSIGEDAFENCTGLTRVYINDIASWCKISFYNYLSNPLYYAEKLYVNNKLVTDLVIPDGVTSIGSYAFYKCTGLTSVSIGNGVTSIGSYAFYKCTGLTSVSIGNGVTSIGLYAFYGCTGLTSIEIPNSVTSIDQEVFSGCTGLTSIAIPNSVTSIGRAAFYKCTGLTSVSIGNGVTNIDDSAFQNCTGLESITVASGNPKYCAKGNCLIEISSGKLELGCKNSVIPDDGSVTSIGGYAFYGCTGLTSIEIPNSVTSIRGYAFYGCTGLTSIEIPNSVTWIGAHAFSGCTGLKSVTFENKSGWCYSSFLSATSGNISSSAINNTSTAAKYLTNDYCYYDWKRS